MDGVKFFNSINTDEEINNLIKNLSTSPSENIMIEVKIFINCQYSQIIDYIKKFIPSHQLPR